MTREEYEDKYWSLTDEKWDELVKEGIVPDKAPGECVYLGYDRTKTSWKKFEELMKRSPKEDGSAFSDDEIIFLGNMDLVAFGNKFRYEAEVYMEDLTIL